MHKHAAWKILTLRCEEASRLASDSLDGPLPRPDRLALRLHLWLCASCRRFMDQIRQLRRLSDRCAAEEDIPGTPMPADLRERIKRSLGEG